MGEGAGSVGQGLRSCIAPKNTNQILYAYSRCALGTIYLLKNQKKLGGHHVNKQHGVQYE